jgi:hypothetical protein
MSPRSRVGGLPPSEEQSPERCLEGRPRHCLGLCLTPCALCLPSSGWLRALALNALGDATHLSIFRVGGWDKCPDDSDLTLGTTVRLRHGQIVASAEEPPFWPKKCLTNNARPETDKK